MQERMPPERYLKSDNLAFKLPLVFDNSLDYPQDLGVAHQNIHSGCLSSRIISLLHPLHQSLITTLKTYQTRRTVQIVLVLCKKCISFRTSECWKSFRVADCMVYVTVFMSADLKIFSKEL